MGTGYVYAKDSTKARRKACAKYPTKVVTKVKLAKGVRGKVITWGKEKKYIVTFRERKK